MTVLLRTSNRGSEGGGAGERGRERRGGGVVVAWPDKGRARLGPARGPAGRLGRSDDQSHRPSQGDLQIRPTTTRHATPRPHTWSSRQRPAAYQAKVE